MTDQIVAMSLEQGKYFAFRGTARRVWDLLETPLSREDLIHALAADYDVTPEQCRRDCEPFLRDLLAHGLIEEATE
ncbi:MAG: PqqD family peptide modification chaperone [Pseudomonadota bacterium]